MESWEAVEIPESHGKELMPVAVSIVTAFRYYSRLLQFPCLNVIKRDSEKTKAPKLLFISC